MGVAPLQDADALAHGTLMHSVLESYYTEIKNGKSPMDAQLVAENWLAEYMQANNDFIGASTVAGWLATYWSWTVEQDARWEILEVEKSYEIPITNDFIFKMKLDLLILDHADMKIKLVDHKSTYDFWSQDDFMLNGQFPKYIGALRFNGINVDEVIVNQIRTRKIKAPTLDQLYKRVPVHYNNNVIRRAMQEQIVASQEIVDYRALPDAERERQALRIANKFNCKGCGVRSLCTAEFQGAPIDYLLASEYKTNPYNAELNPSEELSQW
jgi:hypothetical protein